VGVLLPLSGPYRSFGEACLRGVELAFGAVGGAVPPVRLAIVDTRGEAGAAAEGYRQLAADPGVAAVLGPMMSWEAAAVRDETAAVGLAVLSFAPRSPAAGAPFFRFSMGREDQVEALVEYALGGLRLSRWAVLYPRDSFGSDTSLLFRERVESLGGRVVAAVGYDPQKTDFQADVELLRSRIGTWQGEGSERRLELSVDGIFLPDSAERVVLLASHLAFFDLRGLQLLGTEGWNDSTKLLQGLPYVEGAVFVAGFFLYSFRPEVRAFVTEYRDAFGSDPGVLEAYGYDAARLVRSELEGGATDRRAMAARMRTPRRFLGATGWSERRPDGTFRKGLFLLTVKDGVIQEVEQPAPWELEAAQGSPGAPNPPRPEGLFLLHPGEGDR
jgi:ABC-type branched-subunit amino acid transport system substrate-binding protein